jgi:hypothetical protein
MLDLSVEINNHKLGRVKETTFSGIILDEHLSWKSHISHIASKVSKSIGIIYKSRFCLTRSALRTLYFALVYSYFNYCSITIWGSTYSPNLNRLILLQKKVIRILCNVTFDAHTSPLFKSSNLLKFNDIYPLNLGKFMFSYKSNLLPQSFINFFSITDQVHTRNLRSAGEFYIPFCRTKTKQFSIKYQGPKFLDPDIRNTPKFLSFLSKLKNFFLIRTNFWYFI